MPKKEEQKDELIEILKSDYLEQEEKNRELNILLTEYSKAQDSAEHHDYLSWIAISIMIGGLLILIGGISQLVVDPETAQKEFLFLTSLLGLVLTAIFLPLMLFFFRIKKKAKYERCQAIEMHVEKEFGVQMINQLMFKAEKIKRKEINAPDVGEKSQMTRFFFLFLIIPISGIWIYLISKVKGCQFAINISLAVIILWLVLIHIFPRTLHPKLNRENNRKQLGDKRW